MFGIKTWLRSLFLLRRDQNEMLRTALAGDGIQKKLFIDIAEALGLRRFIETGTFMGKTTLWLARTFAPHPILTCEIDERLYNEASKRLRRETNVTCFCGDSAKWIQKVCACDELESLFFLDAHGMSENWHMDPPLEVELKSIGTLRTPTVVVIDDFKVPNRPDFAFSVNGSMSSFGFPQSERMSLSGTLDLELIEPWLCNSDRILLPKYCFKDALRFQSDPLHSNLIGHVVILHACQNEGIERVLSLPIVTSYYTTIN